NSAQFSLDKHGLPDRPSSRFFEDDPMLLAYWLKSLLGSRTFRRTCVTKSRKAPLHREVNMARAGSIERLEDRTLLSSTVIVSDSFNRADSVHTFGTADNAFGGSGTHSYINIFPPQSGNGANLTNNALQNFDSDFGGVMLSANGSTGEDLGQDLNITVDLLVPTDAQHHTTAAGPYFRSMAASDF